MFLSLNGSAIDDLLEVFEIHGLIPHRHRIDPVFGEVIDRILTDSQRCKDGNNLLVCVLLQIIFDFLQGFDKAVDIVQPPCRFGLIDDYLISPNSDDIKLAPLRRICAVPHFSVDYEIFNVVPTESFSGNTRNIRCNNIFNDSSSLITQKRWVYVWKRCE